MSTNPEGVQASEGGRSGLAKLALLSLLTGAAIGAVIGCFRVALKEMNTSRTDTITWAHQWPVLGFVLVCTTVAATTVLAAWLVQRSGQPAAGSESGGCCNRGTNQNEAQHRPLVSPGDRVSASSVQVFQCHLKTPDDKADCGTCEKRQQGQFCQAKLSTFTGLDPFGVRTHRCKIAEV